MIFTLIPSSVFAVEAETGLCEHHPEHTAECRYKEAQPGHPCEHEHTAACYTDELICGLDELTTVTDATTTHTHTQDCYALNCPHEQGEHDAACGYIEAVEGTPCGYICAECGTPDRDSGTTGTTSGNGLPAPEESKSETIQPEGVEGITITAFDALGEAVQYQSVPAGTKLDSLTLPATLGASGYTMVPDTEPVPEPEAVMIEGVTWKPDSPWDETAEQGSYTFTPVLPEAYTLAEGAECPGARTPALFI